MVVLGVSPGRQRADWAIYAALLSIGYVLFYGWLVAKGNGLPYVMDNNESFSSLWHAANLYNFGFGRSFGLTDEAYGFSPDAHPYVYTHQGNFPRLFALAIYAAGARTVEAQIVATTFTVGLAAMLFAFAFLSRATGSRPFAALATALIFTDYLLVVQWQVVTYRVWHAFFVFSTFFCVDWFEREHKKRALACLVFIGAGLFYFELVFAACVAAAAVFYVLFRNWRTPGVAALTGAALGLGAAVGVATLCGQIVLYMGWDNFVKDTIYTFSARNQFADTATMERTLRTFMESNRIVFWYNLFDASAFRNPFYFVASITHYELQLHTPLLLLLLTLPLVGYALTAVSGARAWGRRTSMTRRLPIVAIPFVIVGGHLLHRLYRGEFGLAQWMSIALIVVPFAAIGKIPKAERERPPVYAGLAVLLGGLPSFLEYQYSVYAGLGHYSPVLVVFAFAYAVAIAFFFSAASQWGKGAQEVAAPVLGAGPAGLVFFVSTAVLLLLALRSPFGMGWRPVDGLLSWLRWVDPAIAVLGAALIHVVAVQDRDRAGKRIRLVPPASLVGRLNRASATNALAVMVMLVSPFLYNERYQLLWYEVSRQLLPEPLPRVLVVLALLLMHGIAQLEGRRFLTDFGQRLVAAAGIFAAAGYAAYVVVYLLSPGYVFTGYRFRFAPLTVFFTDVAVALAVYLVFRSMVMLAEWRGWRLPKQWGIAVVGVAALYWINVQVGYVMHFPADQFGILQRLRQPPFAGASFVSNTYAAPIAAFTGTWAYIDQDLAQARVVQDGGVRRLKTDDRYLWLADRDKNPVYRRPEYFMCLVPQSLPSAVQKIRHDTLAEPEYRGCASMELVRYALSAHQDAIPRAKLVAIDTEGPKKYGHETWAILKLDWGK